MAVLRQWRLSDHDVGARFGDSGHDDPGTSVWRG